MPEPVNAHSLTLKFHRFLSQDEWRKVARAVDLFVPFVQEMDANAVTETAEELARVRIQPSSARAPSQASEPQDPRFKYILEGYRAVNSDYFVGEKPTQTCPVCSGIGIFMEQPCGSCGGSGHF